MFAPSRSNARAIGPECCRRAPCTSRAMWRDRDSTPAHRRGCPARHAAMHRLRALFGWTPERPPSPSLLPWVAFLHLLVEYVVFARPLVQVFGANRILFWM